MREQASLCAFLRIILTFVRDQNKISIRLARFSPRSYGVSKSARQQKIVELIDVNGEVTVAELDEILQVSPSTIRRDLQDLARLGQIRRTHGGALPAKQPDSEPPIVQRQHIAGAAKERIGRAAVALVQPEQTIFLGSGSTVQQMARHLSRIPRLTVITNALNIVNALRGHDNIELIIIGGMFRSDELSMVGHVAEQALREFRADLVFMGMRAIHPDHGFTNAYLPEAMTDRAILRMGREVVVLADGSKLGRVSAVFLAPVNAAERLITDVTAPLEVVDALRELDLEVQLV
jgi:DeoR/GlpR family transcriptional regulator of sugar metabolism